MSASASYAGHYVFASSGNAAADSDSSWTPPASTTSTLAKVLLKTNGVVKGGGEASVFVAF